MSGRLFSASVLGAAVIIVESPVMKSARAAAALLLCLLILGLYNPNSPVMSGTEYRKTRWNGAGITDERGWYFQQFGLVALNESTPKPDSQIKPTRVQVVENVGTNGYLAGIRMHLIDRNALSDPLLARIPSTFNPDLRVGHYLREVLAGYYESLVEGHNR